MWRTRWRGRRVGAGLAAAALVMTVAAIGPASPAHAASACTDGTGVTVVVDFGAFGGGVDVRCFGGDPASGLSALQGVGFTVTGTQQYGLAFVCGLNGLPTAEPCPRTPPANASWSYWHAGVDTGWSYNSCGATVCDPAPGTVEGWAFGAGAVPRYTPPAAPPANPPDPPPPPGGGGAGGGSGGGSGSGSGGGTGGGGTGGNPIPDADPGASLPVVPDPSDTLVRPATPTPSSRSATVVGAPAASVDGGPGDAWGTLLGIGLVVLLAGAAIVIARRRRRVAATPADGTE